MKRSLEKTTLQLMANFLNWFRKGGVEILHNGSQINAN
jgi:hypothetical protein